MLILPYLPFVPDLFPALTVLAGRFALVVWLVAAVLMLRAMMARLTAARAGRRRRVPAAAAIFLASAAIYGGLAWRFAGTGLFPGGDEPHYLVIAQSLWRDHDLKIENNHVRGDTYEYYRTPLQPALSPAREATARSTRSTRWAWP